MSKYNTGGTAFPVAVAAVDGGVATSFDTIDGGGMSLRDYFAAKAMTASIAGMASRGEVFEFKECAGFSFDMADAMLAERTNHD